MPRTFLHVKEGIKGTDTPVIVFLSQREVASQETELRAFKLDDESVIVSNLDKLFNPIDGTTATPIEHSSQKISTAEYEQLNDLATMKCRECGSLAGVDPDLSFAIANEPIYCAHCGKESAFAFEDEEDLTDVVSSDDDDDDDEVITEVEDTEDKQDGPDSNDTDDLSDADDNESDVNDDATLTGDDDSEDDDSEDDDSEDDEDEDDEELATAKKSKEKSVKKKIEVAADEPADKPVGEQPTPTEAPTSEKPAEEPAPAPVTDPNLVYEKLDAASLADDSAPVKLVTLSTDNSEVAVFMGDSHVGTLRRSQASEKVSSLFADGPRLAAAFKPVFKANMKSQSSGELAAYGYKPVVFEVQVGELFKRRVESEVAAAHTQATTEYSTKLKNMNTLLELAFTGINKGVFGGNTDLLKGIEVALQRGGVKDAKSQARRLLSTHAHNYANAVVEKALELSEKSQDYIDGITETISKATFSDNTEEVNVEDTPAPVVKPVQEVASVDFVGARPQQANANKFSSLVASFRNR